MNKLKVWVTRMEKDYINNLGSLGGLPKERSILLQKYYKSMKNRADWGEVDPKVIKNHITKVMKEEGIPCD